MDQLASLLNGYLNRPEVVIAVGVLTLVSFIVLIILAILWGLLPFAVFGTKKKLDEIISESQKANTWLEELVSENQKMNSWLSEIMSESKRTTVWLSEMITEIKAAAAEAPARQDSPPEKADTDPNDQRKHPRLEFHCTGMIMGTTAVVSDISMGGVFLELDEIPELLKVGQVTNMDLDLPTETLPVRMKVKIVNKNEKGVGCKFVDLSQDNMRAINDCFDEFKNTLPIRVPNEK
jgi:hypothetical protein